MSKEKRIKTYEVYCENFSTIIQANDMNHAITVFGIIHKDEKIIICEDVDFKEHTQQSEPKDNDVEGVEKCDGCGFPDESIAGTTYSKERLCYDCYKEAQNTMRNTAELERLKKVNGELVKRVSKSNEYLTVLFESNALDDEAKGKVRVAIMNNNKEKAETKER